MQSIEVKENSQKRAQADQPRLVIEKETSPFNLDFQGSRSWSLGMGLLWLVSIYLYAPIFVNLAKTWMIRDDYSHGFLVPFISLYLVWRRREWFKQLQIQPALSGGIAVVITGGLMLLLGKAGGVIALQELSLVVMIAGLVLCLFGKSYLNALGFPILYLLFMIPIADYILDPLHWAFQLTTAKMGVNFLQALGFAAYLENQYIVLPSITLEVAQACSGINYLISIIAIGIPLAYVTQKNVWCRWTLVISAVIIGVIANWVRVASIGIWAYYGGQVLHGPFHIFQALFVAQLGFIALFAGAWILSKVPAGASKTFQVHPGFRSEKKDAASNRFMDRPWLAPLLILIGLSSYLYFHQQIPVPLKTELALFPMSIVDWKGRVNEPQDAVFRVQGADHELVRTYTSRSGNEIQLYVAYFESQRHSKEIVNFLTATLHEKATGMNIPIEGGEAVTVNQARIANERGFFWYDLNGRTVANRYRAKLATTLDNVIHGRTNGALVLVTTVHKDRDNDENLREEEMAFIRELIPVLRRYLP